MSLPAGTQDPTAERIKAILRRDLKLGHDAELRDDTPLMGGDFDLDSLDVLLLLTSIEKEFGLKVPSETVGQQVFKTVGSLSVYLSQRRSAIPAPAAGSAAASDRAANPVAAASGLLAELPHREPFRFVSRIVEVRGDGSGEGVWSVTGGEAFLAGHFPGDPVVPGVLIAEALAQLSGLVAAAQAGDRRAALAARGGRLAHADVRFEGAVVPPAEIALRSKRVQSAEALHRFEVSAAVAGRPVARGTITLALAAEYAPPAASAPR